MFPFLYIPAWVYRAENCVKMLKENKILYYYNSHSWQFFLVEKWGSVFFHSNAFFSVFFFFFFDESLLLKSILLGIQSSKPRDFFATNIGIHKLNYIITAFGQPNLGWSQSIISPSSVPPYIVWINNKQFLSSAALFISKCENSLQITSTFIYLCFLERAK